MAEYRLHLRQSDWTFRYHAGINAADDEAALALAQTIYTGADFELWCGQRFICTVTSPAVKVANQATRTSPDMNAISRDIDAGSPLPGRSRIGH